MVTGKKMLHKSGPEFTESFHWIGYKHAAQTNQHNYSNTVMQSLKSPVPRTWSEQIWQEESVAMSGFLECVLPRPFPYHYPNPELNGESGEENKRKEKQNNLHSIWL